MWFCSPGRLVQGKNENLSPSAKRLLRLLTLWTLSDNPYLAEVLQGHHVHCAFINTQEKISPTEASGEIGENFILVKNTHHTVPINYPHLVRGCGLPPFPLFPHSPD